MLQREASALHQANLIRQNTAIKRASDARQVATGRLPTGGSKAFAPRGGSGRTKSREGSKGGGGGGGGRGIMDGVLSTARLSSSGSGAYGGVDGGRGAAAGAVRPALSPAQARESFGRGVSKVNSVCGSVSS